MFKRPEVPGLTEEQAQALIQNSVKERKTLADISDRMRSEMEQLLRNQGVPEGMIRYMNAVQKSRVNYTELARKLFPVEPMPGGASPIYFSVPEEPSRE